MYTDNNQANLPVPPVCPIYQGPNYYTNSPPAVQQNYYPAQPTNVHNGQSYYQNIAVSNTVVPNTAVPNPVPPSKEYQDTNQVNAPSGNLTSPGGGFAGKISNWSPKKRTLVFSATVLVLILIIGLGAGLGPKRHHHHSSSSSGDGGGGGGYEYGSPEYCDENSTDCGVCVTYNSAYCSECSASDTCYD